MGDETLDNASRGMVFSEQQCCILFYVKVAHDP